MAARKHVIPFLLLIIVGVTPLLAHGAPSSPQNRIDFWQNNYDELRPSDDPLAQRAHNIFERVLNAAGRRPGVVPRLFIVDNESNLIPLAIAIPDGSIIISKKVLNICYKDMNRGDDRLAFILGHEIAHQLKDDFWHLRFFQIKNPDNHETLDEVRAAVRETDKILAKEIQADEHGIVYAAMAGFNTRAIIAEDEEVNFFEYLAAALDPAGLDSVSKDETHPSPKQRAITVKSRLMQVVEKTDFYDLGLLFYQTGEYDQAAQFFQEFLRFFPSREVYHNLATCHHQMALRHYREWQKKNIGIPFKLSLSIDPITRAKGIHLRANDSAERLYNQHIAMAIKYYETAIDQDPAYGVAYNNLGCALVVKGEVYKAIGLLKNAFKLAPHDPQTLNNLGVAFFQAENPAKALEYLTKANQMAPDFGAPLFNLGKIAHSGNDPQAAEKHWLAYLEIDSHSLWAEAIRELLSLKDSPSRVSPKLAVKSVLGLEIGAYEDEIPKEWGLPTRSKDYSLGEYPFKVNVYTNGYMTMSQDDEIIVITTLPACKGATKEGICRGDTMGKVATIYGPPEGQIVLSNGNSWLYPSKGMAFVILDKKVSNWTLF